MRSLLIIFVTLTLVEIGSSSYLTHSINSLELEPKTTEIQVQDIDDFDLIMGMIRFSLCIFPKFKSRFKGISEQHLGVTDGFKLLLQFVVECMNKFNSDSKERVSSDSFISRTGHSKEYSANLKMNEHK